MAISPQFKDELRARIRLSDIIGRKVKLTRAGYEFKACCPFHHEKTPSFYVNDQKQFYHCFGCGAHGDVITFTMEQDNLPFMEAMESLAAQAGMEVPKPSPEQKQVYELRDRLKQCTAAATKWFQEQLFDIKHKQILNYAFDRGLSEQTLKNFRVGYAPGDMDSLILSLKGQGFTDKEIIESSLARPSKKTGGNPYNFFRDRLMFPVTDGRGQPIAFGGRILPDELRQPDTGDYKPPKYMNSTDTPLFHKGRMVYNESHARYAAGQDEAIFITEGYMDVIALDQAGYKGGVAPLGTALTEDQIQKVWSMIPSEVKEPYICFDGDNAGKRAAERAVARMMPLLKPGCSARFVFMPEGEDPDSLIKKHGKGAFNDCVAQAKPMIDVVWGMLTDGQNFDTPERLAGLEKSINTMTSDITDNSVQYHYRNALRQKMRESFRPKPNYKKFNNGQKQWSKDPVIDISKPSAGLQDNSIHATLLVALFEHPYLIAQYEEDISSIVMHDTDLNDLRDELINIYEESDETLTKKLMQERLDESMVQNAVSMMRANGAFLKDSQNIERIEIGFKQLLQNALGRGIFKRLKRKV